MNYVKNQHPHVICKHISYASLKAETDFHTLHRYLPRINSFSLASLLLTGGRIFLSSVGAKYMLTQSCSRYGFPELPCGGQTGDTAPMSAVVSFHSGCGLLLAVCSHRGSEAEGSF